MYFDTHAHLDDARYDEDREAVIARMREEGIDPCMTVGANMEMNEKAVDLAQRYPGYLYAAVGIHPNDAAEWTEEALARLRAWAKLPCVKAWGEIGLDYHYDDVPRDVQKEVFLRQLDEAMAADLPVILHIREAHGDALELLRGRRGRLPRGVAHCYSGSWESAREYMDLGFFISFTGSVTFKNATRLAEVSDKIPLDRLLIETDSPYMAPVPLRGQRNDPCNVKILAKFLADRRGMDVEELARITAENGKGLFSID
jgi:TatD DNase family protein